MEHKMKLNGVPFSQMKSGRKSIELRLLDEKRRQIRVGDRILFENRDTGERLCRTVAALHVFDSFASLYRALPLTACGYTEEEAKLATAADMDAYYPKEEQARCGVVGIELRIAE